MLSRLIPMKRTIWRLFPACLAALLPAAELVAAPAAERHVVAPRGLCERVARLENENRLGSMLVRPRPAGVQRREAFSESTSYDQFEYQLDINNDGTAENVTVLRQPDDDDAELLVRDASGNPLTFVFAPEPDEQPRTAYRETDSANFGFISMGGRVYTVQWASGSYPMRESSWLSNVAFVDSSNTAHPVCRFAATRERSSHALKGNAPVCDAVLKHKQVYVPFDIPLAGGGPIRVPDGFGDHVVSAGAAARVDIDNDGVPDQIAKLIHPVHMSHGCAQQSLARLDDERSAPIVSSGLEFGYEATVCDDQHLEPFVFDGITYVEQRYSSTFPSNFHYVRKLGKGASTEVCRFDVRKHYRVASEYEVFSGDDTAWLLYQPERPYAFGLWEKAVARNAAHLLDRMWKHEPEFRADLGAPDTAFPYLRLAIESGRGEFVDWLLDHGVDINVADMTHSDYPETALEVALDVADEYPWMPLKLIRRGADPGVALSDIVSFAEEQGASGRTLVREAARGLGYVPEEFFEYGAEDDPKLLGELVGSGLPPALTHVNWPAGEDASSEWWMAEDAFDDATPAVRAAFRTLAARRPRLARKVEVSSRYEHEGERWEFRSTVRTRSELDEFQKFATATCLFYLPAECGSDRLVSRTRAWVERLPDCEPALRERYGDYACRVVGYAAKWDGEEGGWGELIDSSAPRQWPQTSERKRSR
jgi:hypothetical protein